MYGFAAVRRPASGHFVYSFADTGNLPGRIVLVINTLAGGHLDGLGSGGQLLLGNGLVTGFDGGKYLLHSGLDTGAQSLISVCLCAVYQNSLFCGFNVSQVVHLQFVYKIVIDCFTLARHGGLM